MTNDEKVPKLSIIVPIYNVEEYLPRCLDSILAQTYGDFEAILINDGSPDRCGEIIEEYARRDARFVPIHQNNGGVSAARNAGLRAAKGEYIGFVDPDDWIEPEMYQILIEETEQTGAELAICRWFDNDGSGRETEHKNTFAQCAMSREQCMNRLLNMPSSISGSSCNKLFRKELILKGFEKTSICEDNLFVANYISGVRNAICIDIPLYHVFTREESATRKNPDKVALGLEARRKIIGIADAVGEESRMRAEALFLDQCIFFCGKSAKTQEPYRTFATEEFLSYWKQNTLSIWKNKMIALKLKIRYLQRYIELTKENRKE